MKPNESVRKAMLDIIQNQIKANDPKETKIAYKRLKKQGFDEFETMQNLGQCIVLELFNVIKFKKEFNKMRYINRVNRLPDDPNEIEE